MDNSSDKFPWPLLLVVIVATLAVTAGVDKYRERKAAAAQATAQMAVHVPDYTQSDAPKAPRKVVVERAADPTAPASDLYAWSNVGDGSSFTCESVESTEAWLGAARRRISGTPGARVELVSDWQAFTFTPRGDGTELMVKTFFGRGHDFCRNATAEQKGIYESKTADEKAYLAAHANDPAETPPAPAAIRAPGTLPEKEAGKRWYLGVDGLQAPLSWNCQPMTDDEIRRALSFMEARGGLIARWRPSAENDDHVFTIEFMDSMVNAYGYQAAEELRRTKIYKDREYCMSVMNAIINARKLMVDEFKAGR